METTLDLTPTVTRFSSDALWTGVRDDDRDAWMAQRHKLVTASKVAALLGLSPFQDPIDVYAEMLAPPAPDVDLGLQDPRTWGKALELAVAQTASKYYRWELRMSGALLVSRKYDKIGATLDAELGEGGEYITYEGKTTSAWRYRDWDEETGAAPDHVFVQKQTQLLVTGAPRGYICCLIGGNRFSRIGVDPSAEFFELIRSTVDEFLDQVARLDPPPVTYRSRNALTKLYPEDDGGSVVLPADAVEWTREIQEINSTREALKRKKEELENLIRSSIGSAKYGILPLEVGGKGRWKNAIEASGNRVLRCVKAEPERGAKAPRLAAARAPIALLEHSFSANETRDIANPVRFRSRRRASR